MLRAWIINVKEYWDEHFPLIKFDYNYSYHSRIGMSLFDALYCRRCRSLIFLFEVDEIALICPKLVYEANEKVGLIKERLQMEQSWQQSNVY